MVYALNIVCVLLLPPVFAGQFASLDHTFGNLRLQQLGSYSRNTTSYARTSPFAFVQPQSRGLQERQTTCSSGEKVCKSVCILSSYSCCSTGIGGCEPGYYCVPGGCCPNGQVCDGAGDACTESDQPCGVFCIPESYTCCPDELGGCAPSTYCDIGSDGVYGCCPDGETCSGNGGSGGDDSGLGLCDSDEAVCGLYCIPSSYTCCPDLSGACPAGTNCAIGDDGEYGCCPQGATCTGSAGDGDNGGTGGNGSSTSGDGPIATPTPTYNLSDLPSDSTTAITSTSRNSASFSSTSTSSIRATTSATTSISAPVSTTTSQRASTSAASVSPSSSSSAASAVRTDLKLTVLLHFATFWLTALI